MIWEDSNTSVTSWVGPLRMVLHDMVVWPPCVKQTPESFPPLGSAPSYMQRPVGFPSKEIIFIIAWHLLLLIRPGCLWQGNHYSNWGYDKKEIQHTHIQVQSEAYVHPHQPAKTNLKLCELFHLSSTRDIVQLCFLYKSSVYLGIYDQRVKMNLSATIARLI